MKSQLITLIAIALLYSCSDTSKQDADSAYFGGEIINPSSGFVVLYQDHKFLDTLSLDQDSRFLHKIDSLKAGLYSFYHGGEYQIVLLEPKDSLMFRLNTLDFDESLVYTGKGSKKNNFLTEMYLGSEKENKTVLRYCQLNPTEFENRLDSLKKIKVEKLNAFNDKHKHSELFKTIAQANIDYNYYMSKEVYPFAYYAYNELKNFESLPEGFYNYRKDIDYNNEQLKSYFPYNWFLKVHFRNLALKEHFKHSNDSVFNRQSIGYNLIKIHLIDSLVNNSDIKNQLLNRAVFRFLSRSNNGADNNKIVSLYLDKSTDTAKKREVVEYVKSAEKLMPGNTLPEVVVIGQDNKPQALKALIKRPTTLFFWSSEMKRHFKNSQEKKQELQEKYPEVDFVSINIDKMNAQGWKTILKQYQFENEYRFKNPERAKEILALYPINKAIIVEKNGTIAHSNANIFSVMFEEQLLGVISE